MILGRLYKEFVQVRGFLWSFVTSSFFTVMSVSPTPNPQAGRPPLSAVRDCLFNIFAATLHTCRGVSSFRNLRTRHAVATRDGRSLRAVAEEISKYCDVYSGTRH
jgi:hypothetical protein